MTGYIQSQVTRHSLAYWRSCMFLAASAFPARVVKSAAASPPQNRRAMPRTTSEEMCAPATPLAQLDHWASTRPASWSCWIGSRVSKGYSRVLTVQYLGSYGSLRRNSSQAAAPRCRAAACAPLASKAPKSRPSTMPLTRASMNSRLPTLARGRADLLLR